MSRYAADTSVSAEKSRAEIEATLRRYGADSFGYGWETDRAIVQFRMLDRQVRFVLDMPDRNDRAFTHTPERKTARTPAQAEAAWEQATRQRPQIADVYESGRMPSMLPALGPGGKS